MCQYLPIGFLPGGWLQILGFAIEIWQNQECPSLISNKLKHIRVTWLTDPWRISIHIPWNRQVTGSFGADFFAEESLKQRIFMLTSRMRRGAGGTWNRIWVHGPCAKCTTLNLIYVIVCMYKYIFIYIMQLYAYVWMYCIGCIVGVTFESPLKTSTD